ncbi:MAG: riboflavin biosynthesis protein RibF [Deltaproteobacteria bacterium HGW-Deltaproteobacteria-6]|jgi:riboflavin kinase/FMN adenylyltransferase|nr:MAG: riboflavin biosynthesis protein RibF [Deltaproteobacteria bacterium HGW-Deltaproteobacteria-6]
MIIFEGIKSITKDFRGAFVTIGNFDGVHLSHQHICRKLAAEAKSAGKKSLVITFDPHPKMILHPNIRPFYLITTRTEKMDLLERCGVDATVIITFDQHYSKTTAEQFVQGFLWEKLAITKIIIGHDYTFGQARQGNDAYLKAQGRKLGFSVEVIKAFKIDDEIVSSTLIRNYILAGNVRTAAKLMGRYYNVAGAVVTGAGRGTGLGYPTANIEPEKELLPPPGIYAAFVMVDDHRFMGALNIGAKPTFEDYTSTFEVFLLDYTGDLRGNKINVLFVEKLRDIVKFDGPESLKRQIALDVERTKEILKSNK